MKKRNLAVSLTLAAAMALTTACSGGSQSSSTPETTAAQKDAAADTSAAAEGGSSDLDTSNPITIAVAAPMTGDNSEYGIGFANAAKLMAQKWNDNGGCLGREVQIVEYDDKNTSEEATTIAQKIVSDKDNIAGVIGHFASGVCMTAAPIYQENGVIEWLAFASNAFNVLVPFYADVEETPEYLSNTTGEVSTENFYWSSRLIAAMADASYRSSVFHIERYQEHVMAKGHELIHHYDELLAKETDAVMRRRLREEANRSIAKMLQKETADTLDKVLFELSSQMKNAYSRSDA